jgi:very-short-patch-repair endonuclease
MRRTFRKSGFYAKFGGFARLRRAKLLTPSEKFFGDHFFKNRPELTFWPQYPVYNFILDFFCLEAELNIEIDGKGHSSKKNILKDQERDSFLTFIGIHVVRVRDEEVLNHPQKVHDFLLPIIESRKKILEMQGRSKL